MDGYQSAPHIWIDVLHPNKANSTRNFSLRIFTGKAPHSSGIYIVELMQLFKAWRGQKSYKNKNKNCMRLFLKYDLKTRLK